MATDQSTSPSKLEPVVQEPQAPGASHGFRLLLQPMHITNFLLLLLPPTLFFSWDKSQLPSSSHPPTATLVKTALATGTIGMLLLIALQAAASLAILKLLFTRDTQKLYAAEAVRNEADLATLDPATRAQRAALARNPRSWAAAVVFCFFVAGFLEESLKYTAVVFFAADDESNGTVAVRLSYYLPLALAATLGFSTVEGLAIVCVDAARYAKGKLALDRLMYSVAARTVLGPVGHALVALLLGANMVAQQQQQQPVSWFRGLWGATLGPAFFHGLFDFVLVAICLKNGHVGWVFPRGKSLALSLVLGVSVQACLAVVVWGKLESLGEVKFA